MLGVRLDAETFPSVCSTDREVRAMHKIMTVRLPMSATLVGLSLAVAGCTAQAGDRAGGDVGKNVRVLTLASAGAAIDEPLTTWADQVSRLSGGTLRIEFKPDWRSGEPLAEAGIIHDVVGGKVDLAWVGARVWDRFGVTDFQALVAPMLIDSQALQANVFSAGIAAGMVNGVDSAGVVGLGVLPGPLRKVLGVSKPFVSPADFAGQVVGLQDGAVAEKTLRALGAQPRNVPSGAHLDGLDGYEQALGSIAGNHYELTASFVTSNVNLWPRPLVLFAAKGVVASLTSEQRSALRNAAAASLPAAIKSARALDEDAVPKLCKGGLTFTAASAQELRALQVAVQPVYDDLNADPKTRAIIERIQALKAELGAGPDSPICSGLPVGDSGTSSGAILDGTYEMTLTDKEVRKCPGDEGNKGAAFEVELRNGQSRLYAREAGGPWEVADVSTFRVFRDRFEMTDGTGLTVSMHWAFDGKQLTLTDMRNGYCGGAVVWTTHPWVLKRAAATAVGVPDGTYQMTLPDKEARKCPGDEHNTGGLNELVLHNGDVQMYNQTAGGPFELGWSGSYRFFRDRFEVTEDSTGIVLNMHWAFDGKQLSLTDMRGGECGDAMAWTTHPWVLQKSP
jgi:TRAP-type C4-dicarboxylate transport system substrate-binding protein